MLQPDQPNGTTTSASAIDRVRSILVSTALIRSVRFNVRAFGWPAARRLPVLIMRGARVELGPEGRMVVPADLPRGSILVGAHTTMKIDGTVTFGGNCSIGPRSNLYVGPGAELVIGRAAYILEALSLNCLKRIELKGGASISWNVAILDSDFHPILDADDVRINEDQEVVIGEGVWIGARSMVLKGTRIGDGSILAAGSTAAGDLSAPGSIYAGVPAKLRRSGVRWTP